MYTLSHLRTRVDALKRKLALELQVLRLHRIAEDFSLRWVCAASDHEPLPETHPFIRYIADNGFRFHTFMDLHRYLERCRDTGDTPDCWGIIRSLYANRDLDRISQMVDKCHSLAEPDPDPDEDSEGFESSRPLAHRRGLIYWAGRALRRYASPAAIIRYGLHLTPGPVNTPKLKCTPLLGEEGPGGDGNPLKPPSSPPHCNLKNGGTPCHKPTTNLHHQIQDNRK